MDSLATQQRENVIKRREKNKKHTYTGEIEYVQISRKERKKERKKERNWKLGPSLLLKQTVGNENNENGGQDIFIFVQKRRKKV